MDLRQTGLAVFGAAAVYYVWYKRYKTPSITDVPGPKNPSWVHGHEWWWQYEEFSVVEKNLLEEYGTIARWNGLLGEKRLWIADSKAIHHVLQGSSHLYEKPGHIRERIAMLLDEGLVWADGDAHKRQRRAMTPAFGLVEAKALYPYFTQCSNSLCDKWHDMISNTGSGRAAIINVNVWLSKATLDAIGAGAFGYDLGALEQNGDKLATTYMNLTFDAFGRPSKARLFVMDASRWAPKGLITWMADRSKSPWMVRLQENRKCAHEVAVKLIEEKRKELKDGTSQKDLLSLLGFFFVLFYGTTMLSSTVKANAAQRPDWRLNDDEIAAQLRTILFAGHETTARVLMWALWELASNRHVQERLRAEIMETLGRVRSRGDSDFTANDFDSMPYLIAVGKEALRVYPSAFGFMRSPRNDVVLPLSKPIVGVSGKVYEELHVPAGTEMIISTVGYNLNKDIWGSDAYGFRPERWLDTNEKPDSPIGVYGNLSTFSGGPRSCIGWRFAVIEMHTFLVTIVRQFDLSLPDDGREMKKTRLGGITPLVIGEEDKGPQMPLKVTILGNE